ncbi:MAG TPA: class I SAM-dependent methyltransferase [Solirubrobacteraceae bacterium]|nr:class I SAM-dependent methyltransferase [Solirubrobacteraceae bacterium]
MAAQAEAPTADVDDAGARGGARQREEPLVADAPRACRRGRRRARAQALPGGGVDVVGRPARHARASLRRPSGSSLQDLSEAYTPDNLLDRLSDPATLAEQYERGKRRERELLDRHLGIAAGDALSVGCGWHPGRHLLPRPAWRLVAADLDRERPRFAVARGEADAGLQGAAGRLDALPDASFDVVLYRLVLHHVAYAEPLGPVLAEARRLLRPGGALVAIEPNVYHPVGAALAVANRVGLGVRVHGTPDDIPLSPRRLAAAARAAGLAPQLHAVTYSWRRLPVRAQRAVGALDRFGSAPGLRWLGHTLMLIAHRPG